MSDEQNQEKNTEAKCEEVKTPSQENSELQPRRFRERATKALKEVPVAPTMLTLCNFFCGFLAICYITDSFSVIGEEKAELLYYAAWLIFLGMFFDLFDGKVARLTNQASEFGAQMDSMADLMTFGIAPAFLAKGLIEAYNIGVPPKMAYIIGAFYAACAALRLARFNVETELDEDSHRSFKGLPSPAAGGVVASIVLLFLHKFPSNESLDFLPNFKDPGTAQTFLIITLIFFTILTGVSDGKQSQVWTLWAYPFWRTKEILLHPSDFGYCCGSHLYKGVVPGCRALRIYPVRCHSSPDQKNIPA